MLEAYEVVPLVAIRDVVLDQLLQRRAAAPTVMSDRVDLVTERLARHGTVRDQGIDDRHLPAPAVGSKPI